MNPPPDPDEGETPTSDWIGFALNVGLKLAETFGLGLTLFNALRARFPDVAGAVLGDITSTIGQAVRAATGLTSEELNQNLALGDLPIVPASWHQGEPGDRIIAGVDVIGISKSGGSDIRRRTWVNALEFLTPQDLIDEAEALFDAAMNETDPTLRAQIETQASQLVFLARRF